jgi:hypothetical protein
LKRYFSVEIFFKGTTRDPMRIGVRWRREKILEGNTRRELMELKLIFICHRMKRWQRIGKMRERDGNHVDLSERMKRREREM